MRAERRQARPRAVQAGFRPFRGTAARGVVGADGVDRAFEKSLPQRGLVLGRAHRRDHLDQEAVRIVAVDAEIGRGGFDREMVAGAARGAHHFEPLMAGEVHHVEVRTGELRQIDRGLDRQRLGDRRMRVLPVGQRAGRLLRQFLAGGDRSARRFRNARRPPRRARATATFLKPSSSTSSVTDFTMPGMPDM